VERAVAGWLRWGTWTAFSLCAAGLAWMALAGVDVRTTELPTLAACPGLCTRIPGAPLVLAGIGLLVAVSAGRLAVLALYWGRRGDRRMAWLAATALVLVLAALVFRV